MMNKFNAGYSFFKLKSVISAKKMKKFSRERKTDRNPAPANGTGLMMRMVELCSVDDHHREVDTRVRSDALHGMFLPGTADRGIAGT